MENGEIINGGIVEQTHKTMQNLIAILEEAGYGLEDVVRAGVWLQDPRDFWSFNKVFASYFKSEHAPARAGREPQRIRAHPPAASGVEPELPAHLADLMERRERLTLLPNDLGKVEAFVREHARAVRGAAA